ncbi:transglutaminase family protein [Arenibacter sp. F26102]|uniref:transglutaminase family protein n=1 Tax=Arenibacter sp. F26102 TaxID=2926416 RepID=UPI001FF4E9DB|nr:transglutaminase family protein [Arenibacter sp. F26102]MCK0145802.1 transglutaminase family protein [Arenibacter sp. F26102]
MMYEVKHKTVYKYQSPVSLCHNIVFQVGANNSLQEINSSICTIDPEPNYMMEREDFFENKYLYFSVQKVHKNLIVESISQITVDQPFWLDIIPSETPTWESVVKSLRSIDTSNDIRQFYLESPYVTFLKDIRAYALKSFTPNRPIMEAMLELNNRIYSDFTFTPGFTEISTPLEEVFKHKKGVCQDYAHFGLACVRSIGLSARYVSGYIETIPPPGKPKLAGADASHAWMSLYIPNVGWVEFDATNNLLVADQHIRVAKGRDFSDVVPLKGIVYSGGGQHMDVTVDVTRIG